MSAVAFFFFVCVVGGAVAAPTQTQQVQTPGNSSKVIIELNPIKILHMLLEWAEENNFKLSDFFNSDFFNSDFFNSDFFNSDYFNSDFFNSDLFNSDIFNRVNFHKLTTALFALDGVSNEGTFQPDVARILVGFFETKDWEGLKQYLNSLPNVPIPP